MFVRLSVAWNAYLSGTGVPGPAVLAAAALLGHVDRGCPTCLLPVKNFTSGEICASGGGLLVAPMNTPRRLFVMYQRRDGVEWRAPADDVQRVAGDRRRPYVRHGKLHLPGWEQAWRRRDSHLARHTRCDGFCLARNDRVSLLIALLLIVRWVDRAAAFNSSIVVVRRSVKQHLNCWGLNPSSSFYQPQQIT